ncbi:hypothetical protein DICVIV_10004 [Dictyocaulus viviparus]|uniref:Uncharacterized protein n=1 Tax=Dictyocaulus viviparus TaxID=29172 RepID=A0A0D8XH23_DICVI|nr:hypothetical protein DICVIV_10004 [Dictyocaulus viviparus]
MHVFGILENISEKLFIAEVATYIYTEVFCFAFTVHDSRISAGIEPTRILLIQNMNAVMALLDGTRTSDIKMLTKFRYPDKLSKLVVEHDKLQGFVECGEHDVQLLKRVKITVPNEYKDLFHKMQMDDSNSIWIT